MNIHEEMRNLSSLGYQKKARAATMCSLRCSARCSLIPLLVSEVPFHPYMYYAKLSYCVRIQHTMFTCTFDFVTELVHAVVRRELGVRAPYE